MSLRRRAITVNCHGRTIVNIWLIFQHHVISIPYGRLQHAVTLRGTSPLSCHHDNNRSGPRVQWCWCWFSILWPRRKFVEVFEPWASRSLFTTGQHLRWPKRCFSKNAKRYIEPGPRMIFFVGKPGRTWRKPEWTSLYCTVLFEWLFPPDLH